MIEHIYEEEVLIDDKRYKKVTVITITTTLSPQLEQTEKLYSYKDLVDILCSLNPSKDRSVIKDSFQRHLKRRLETIEQQGLSLPADLYVSDKGNTLNKFQIVRGCRPYLFRSI